MTRIDSRIVQLLVLEKLCKWVLRHRIPTLIVTGAFVIVAFALVFHGGKLTSGAFRDTESGRAEELVESVTGHPSEVTFVAIFQAPDRSSQDVARAMDDALAPLRADERVASIITPEDAPLPIASGMSDAGGTTRIAYVTLRGDFPEALRAYPSVRERIVAPGVEITCTGRLPMMSDMNATLEHDLVRAELIALPLALLVLVLVFRSAYAAATPVGIGSLAVLGGIGTVFGLSHGMDVAMYTVNVCSLIGLGVSIDYCLFLVSRYREELAKTTASSGRARTDEAILRAVKTTGHTIAFSGLAVCTGLAGLFFFHGSYLFSMGVGGAIVVALAVVFALTFLPAVLSLLGDRIFRGRLFAPRAASRPRVPFWSNLARRVMKRPLLVGVPTLAVLLAMGVPFLHARLAAADVRVLDRKVEARRGYEILKSSLPEQAKTRIVVAVEFPSSPALTDERAAALHQLAARIDAIPGVDRVESVVPSDASMPDAMAAALVMHPPAELAPAIEAGKVATVGDRVVTMTAFTSATPDTEAARDIVRALRADRVVADGTLSVGGDVARDLDANAFILGRAPHAVAFVVIATLLLLFALLRSVVLPIKAVLMNFLSMAGSFGALVWIFQEGHLGVREPRPLEPTLPVLLFCVLFGLSMDYEVLLLSRVREAWLRTGNNTESVAEGLEKTASLITSAAAIMVAVFAAFAFADVVMIQAVGVGMALAVALDATLVRTLLVPSTMRLMGSLNWWCPRFSFRLRRDGAARPLRVLGVASATPVRDEVCDRPRLDEVDVAVPSGR